MTNMLMSPSFLEQCGQASFILQLTSNSPVIPPEMDVSFSLRQANQAPSIILSLYSLQLLPVPELLVQYYYERGSFAMG